MPRPLLNFDLRSHDTQDGLWDGYFMFGIYQFGPFSVISSLERVALQCLECGWTVMDGVHALLFKAGRPPATS